MPTTKRPSIFISYSHRDEEFAQKLYQKLQELGFRVWYAAEDMKGGEKILEQIDTAIKQHDRLLVVLSETSMGSSWVQTEIYKARKRSKSDGRKVLFPTSLVPYPVIEQWECFDSDSGTDMAREIRAYFIPTFENWTDEKSFAKSFERLKRDLSYGGTATLSEQIRELAQRVLNVPDQIVESFSFSSAAERVVQINAITTEIGWDFINLITWIERNRPQSAELEKRRIAVLENDAELCAWSDIPEYEGGIVKQRPKGATVSDGARKVATLKVFCAAFHNGLIGWADEIEKSN